MRVFLPDRPRWESGALFAITALAFLFASREIGSNELPLDNVLFVLCVIGLGARVAGFNHPSMWCAAIAICGVGLALSRLPNSESLRSCLVAGLLGAAATHRSIHPTVRRTCRHLAYAVLLTSAFVGLRALYPPLALIDKSIAGGVAVVETLVHDSQALGPTAVGVPCLLLALAFGLRMRHGVRSRLWLLTQLVVLWLGFLLTMPFAVDRIRAAFPWNAERASAFDAGWLLPIVFGLAFVDRRSIARRVVLSRRARFAIVTAALLVALGLLISQSPTGSGFPSVQNDRTVLLYDAPHLDRRLPSDVVYGRHAGGMFGYLPVFLRAAGYSVTIGGMEDLRRLAPETHTTLVLVNVPERFPTDVVEKLKTYVLRGGALLALADHTGHDALRLPVNDIVADWGIRVRFDSARPLQPAWLGGMRWHKHPVVRSVQSESDMQIWTGAGLDVGPLADAIVTGRAMFSDPGDMADKDRGYLGDLRYQVGEPLGDFDLVASAEPGDGRVVVFGDTSSFQNTALASNFRFVLDVFDWLTRRPPSASIRRVRFVAGWGAYALLLLFLFYRFIPLYLMGTAALVVCLAAALPTVQGGYTVFRPDPAGPMPRVAHIDLSHRSMHTLLGWTPHSLTGTHLALMRRGYHVFYLTDHREVPQATLQILPAPTAPFSAAETAELLRWIDAGGTCIMSAGRVAGAAIAGLLSELGVEPAGIIMGPCDVELLGGPAHLVDPGGLHVQPQAEILATADGLAVVVRIRRGLGAAFIIADDRFLENANTEDLETHVPENIAAVRRIIESAHDAGEAVR